MSDGYLLAKILSECGEYACTCASQFIALFVQCFFFTVVSHFRWTLQECAPLSCELAFLPDATYSGSAGSIPTSRAWCRQGSVLARGSDRILSGICTIVEIVPSKWNQCQSCLSPSRKQYHWMLECDPLLLDLAFLLDTTCIWCAESKPNIRELDVLAAYCFGRRGSGRIEP